ncbi:MAG: hypothetical protein OEQ49_08620 [Myxococcales bacterium]|nr:hypothetical protein [Myxococcales bacterium]
MRKSRKVFFVVAIGLTWLAGVAPVSAQSYGQYTPRRPLATSTTCAGIRGNGQNLFAHYGALARHVEEYGAIQCAAGGSSGSITAFFVESIWASPQVHNCTGRRCRVRARDARMSLMLKSVVGLVDTGLFEDAATVNALVAGIQAGGIVELLEGPVPEDGVDALVRLLRDLGPLINPELFELFANSPDPVFHATDIIEGLQKGLQFIVDDPKVFLRTSVINFDAFATLVGVYGSFYASYGPADSDGVSAWLDACARPGIGLTWEEAAELPGTEGRTCGETFSDLFNAYREAFAELGGRNRADDPVGGYMPAFGVTGVLTGEAIVAWEEARAAWIAAEPIPFEPDFDDIGVGYWGQAGELRRMGRNLDRRYTDLISEQFVPLGSATWREVLSSSPAEPGFSPGVPLTSGFVSVGGWADPLRVTPLEALDARRTITINRLGGVGGFTESVTRLLNASDAQIEALYSATDPASSFYVGLSEATGVWCTDWDGQGGDPNLLFNDAYNSPLITDDARFLWPRFGYENVGPNFSIGGCTPGVPVVVAE